MNAETFNSLYPVGTLVFAYPGARPEDVPTAARLVTRTRTEAQPVGLDRDGVVWVEGHGAYISLTHVDPMPADEWEEARTEEAVRELGALPMPAGTQPPRTLDLVEEELTGANLSLFEEELETARLRLALSSAQRGRRELRARVAALLDERHSTNESVDEAARARREDRDRIAQLETAAVEARAALAALCHDLDDPGSNALGALYLLQQVTPGTPMEPGETVLTVYRASYDSIVMGLYLTREAAREHCETLLRREVGEAPTFDWVPDDSTDESPEELAMYDDQDDEVLTSYLVAPVEVANAYDPDADE